MDQAVAGTVCGIAGIFDATGAAVDGQVVARMTRAIAHRGPDGEGVYVEGPVGFGHRRLAIIDLTEAGRQPMETPDGRFVITYNGEVYNFRELRKELEGLGHRFTSRTDTEVVLAAYAQWGTEAVPRLNGMFAFAIFDRERRELVLARDRYGIKPLYFASRPGMLAFASEVKALLTHPGVGAAVDPAAVIEYFTFQNFLSTRTLFRDVELLAPGAILRTDVDSGGRPRIEKYWEFNFSEVESHADAKEYADELDRLFTQAVTRQLVSDVPVASYLSGGMDTGAITAIASSQVERLRTFTIGFDMSSASGLELGFDERARAERMSYLFSTEHYEMVLKAGDMERALPELVWHLEEPRVGQSYPNYYAAKLAGSFGKVVLSGAGGDELFAGYPWRYYRAVVNQDYDDYISKYFEFWQRLVPADRFSGLLGPTLAHAGELDTRSLFASVLEQREPLSGPEDAINHSLAFEAKTFLHGLLVVEDKLSMAHSLEARLPFLDNDLVDFALGVPVRYKLGNLGEVVRLNENDPGPKTHRYFARTSDGKLVLRDAMARHIPEDVVSGVKQGFSAPDASWFRGESIDYVRRVTLADHARMYEYLDRSTVHALVNEHLDGRENHRLLIWSLLCFEEFLRVFIDGERPDAA